MAAKLSLVESGIASTSTAVLTAVDTARRDTSAGLSLVSQNMLRVDSRIASLEKLVSGHIKQTRAQVSSQGLSRVSGAQLLARPAMLREACDVVNFHSAGGFSTDPSRHQRMVSSRCGCDLRERTRSVARRNVSAGRTLLSDEHEETSRHLPNCPLYKTSKAQRRVTARITVSIWSRLSVLVQASLACTTGAGGFSISPQLAFRMVVSWESPVANAICAPFLKSRLASETDIVKELAVAKRTILNMFRTGEASPYEQFEDGSNILFARLAPCSQGFMHGGLANGRF